MKAALLSGGMDSIALAYQERPAVAFTIDYGQVCASAEIEAAGVVAEALQCRHEIIRVDCRALGAGDLAMKAAHAMGAAQEWWPYRNQLLVTLAAMRGVDLGVTELLLASVKSDGTFRDGTAEFVERIDALLSFQEGAMRVRAPAAHLTTEELVRRSAVPFSLLAWAHSCHCSNFACGDCRGCYKHQLTMDALGHGRY